jgi:UDP-N-acetylmuramyl pentapeptide phosphotransferase/UDP-N-acetylglucosamine-1-phosphate transferase
MNVYSLIFPILSFLIACGLAYILGLKSDRLGVMDAPDGARKTQDHPVSRLGGAIIAVATLAAFYIALSLFLISFGSDVISALKSSFLGGIGEVGTLTVFVIGAFLLGLLDDLFTINTALKLGLLMLLCIGASVFGLHAETLNSPFGDISFLPALIAGSVLWLLVFTNATNFMDGSNGLSVGCVAIMLIGLCFALISTDSFMIGKWMFPLFGAILGFLIHNLRGKLYAGDAGALGLGALFTSLGLISGLEVWTVATLALPFLIDVLMTLIWRAKHGRSWLQPHLDHAYQRLRLSGWTHLETAILYWGLTATCAAAAVIAAKAGGEAPFIIFWTLCFAGIALWTLHRRSGPAQDA